MLKTLLASETDPQRKTSVIFKTIETHLSLALPPLVSPEKVVKALYHEYDNKLDLR